MLAASVIGTDHVRASLPCQDCALTRVVALPDGGERLVVVVSDGAGSAKHAELGARIACETAIEVLADPALTFQDPTLGARVVASVQAAIDSAAAAHGAVARDFACTLLAAVVGPAWSSFLQIGDGCIVVAGSEPSAFTWIFWPDKGEYANETSFVTGAGAVAQLEVAWRPIDLGALDQPIVDVAIFTDGLERIALDFQQRVAHPSFFAAMFGAVRSLPPGDAAEAAAASADLVGFLGSARVNERTSDDKTLVLATRRGA